jgi:hypothetical protein
MVELRNLLLQHLSHGECVVSDTSSKHRDRYTAYREVAAGFSSSDLADCMLDMVDVSAIVGSHL